MLGEALSAARGIDDAESRARALAKVAERLPAEEGLAIARGIDDARSRAQALVEVAQRLSKEQTTDLSPHQWRDTVRVLAMCERRDCLVNFAFILPLIDALGGEVAIRGLGRSIISVGLWWP